MRLTTKNIAIKILKAKGCLSDLGTRLRSYTESGDTENEQCVREKMLMLSSWIDALSRWKPTIESAYYKKITITYASGSFTFPFIIGSSSINGLDFSNQINVYSGSVNDVLSQYKNAIDCYYSSNDDMLEVKTELSETTLILHVRNVESENINYTDNGLYSQGVTFTETDTTVETTTDTVRCLADEQVLSIVGKIDELCECNC